ncbi:MAG: hypothetical protein ACYCTV_05280 [Leptospirales bacterium]
MEENPIQASALKKFIMVGVVSGISIKEISSGYNMVVAVKKDKMILSAQRGGARIFKRLDTAKKYAAEDLGWKGKIIVEQKAI